jgi:hypothetical protein
VNSRLSGLQHFMNPLAQEIKTQMVKLSQYISDQDSKFIDSYKLFIETASKDQRKAEKFYDIEALK